jgi:tetratricopeptide (TPR) repeat protein
MALTYNRLVELFSAQYMQEPAIYCGRQSLSYDKIAQTSPDRIANTYFFIGQQYNKLEEEDSAAYYYKMALETNPDSKTSLYRDAVSMLALCEYNVHHDTLASLDSLKRMMVQASNEMERLNRFLLIGSIYRDMGQYDSAKVYLEPVLEKHAKGAKISAILLRNIALTEGDTLKANQYALFLAEEGATTANNQARVSTLNDMFQTYLQEKQEAASLRERRKAVRATLTVVLPLVVVLAAVMVILMRRRSKKLMAAQAAEAQRQLNEASQQHDEEQRELQTKVEQATQHTREILQQRVADIYQSNNKNRLQRILEAVDDTYPQIVARLKSEHPELNETERHILLLSFLHFRIKEEADLLGLSENTVGKYRSNLGKTLGKDPISDWV